MRIASPLRKVRGLLERHGLLLLHDAELPSLTACVAGEPIAGSWWGHPKGELIFAVCQALEHDATEAKVVGGKVTLVHPRLWPALAAVGSGRARWQREGLSADERELLAKVRRRGTLRTDRATLTSGRKPGAIVRTLERRLLVHTTQVHTESGRHAKALQTWKRFCDERGLDQLPALDEAVAALTEPVAAWVTARGLAKLLPWGIVR